MIDGFCSQGSDKVFERIHHSGVAYFVNGVGGEGLDDFGTPGGIQSPGNRLSTFRIARAAAEVVSCEEWGSCSPLKPASILGRL